MSTIAVTGADGFIGSALCELIEQRDAGVVRLVRREVGPGSDRRLIGDLESSTRLCCALKGATALIHLAGRAHVLREESSDPEAEFHRVNVLGTMRLANAAAVTGVRRFVFVSSIGVNGNSTEGRRPFTESDTPAPTDPYALSKLEAEQVLSEFCAKMGLELVIVRPPLVCGPDAVGNLRRLVKLAASGFPLPLGAVRNRRSFIGVRNLSDFLRSCALDPKAAGELFVIAEPDSISTPELLRMFANAMNRPSLLPAVPVGLVRAAARVIGKATEFDKLCGSLEVDASKARKLLGWKPVFSFSEEITRAASAFLRHGNGQ